MTVARSSHAIKEGGFDKTDISTWDNSELIHFIAWNFAKNDPNSVEQFQAIRDLERMAEEEIASERRTAELEMMYQDLQRIQNTSPYTQSIQSTSGFWESFRNMVNK